MFFQPLNRERIISVLDAAIRAVDPREAVSSHVALNGHELRIGERTYRLNAINRVFVVGGGKAGMPMAATIHEILGTRITGGAVNVKYGHTRGAGGWGARFEHRGAGMPIVQNERQDAMAQNRPDEIASPRLGDFASAAVVPQEDGAPAPPEAKIARVGSSHAPSGERPDTGPIRVIEAGHPIPDASGMAGAEQIVRLLAGLTERDLVIVLISGGGSALLPLPAAAITLADYQALTGLLLRCGADITEVNAVRKHCSRLQGGQLARLAAPAQVATLILSDVVGTPLDAIASGPTVPDRSSFTDAWAILARYDIAEQAPAAVREHLRRGVAGLIPDTPKPGAPLFERVNNVVIGDNASAGRAAVAEAKRLGFTALLLTTFLQGEAREVGRAVAGLAQGIASGQSDFTPPVCLVLGGETTVTIRGRGTGGRNQELALAAAIALAGHPLPPGIEVAVVSLGTDGSDGPTDAAGGIAAGDSVARAGALGLDARAALDANDSYHLLGALGDLIVTGPTQTNVNDLIVVFVGSPD